MKCTGVKDVFNIYRLSEHVSVCFVCMPLFAEKFIGPVESFGKRVLESVYVAYDRGLERVFHPEEFGAVNGFRILKKQVEWLSGRYAVKRLALDAGICNMPTAKVCKEEGGAPYIFGFPHIPVSISHSGEFAVAVLGRGTHRAVAVDIEKIEENRMERIKGVAFTQREIAMANGGGNNGYYLNWTMKEAYLKYLKKGFSGGIKNVEIMNGKVFHMGNEVEGLNVRSKIIDGAYAFSAIY